MLNFGSLHKGLVGHWELDKESFNPATKRFTDKSAYNDHGTGQGTTVGSATPTFTTDYKGNDDRALTFNGIDDYIMSNDNDVFDMNNVSVAVWLKQNSFINLQGIVTKGGVVGYNPDAWGILTASTTGRIVAQVGDGIVYVTVDTPGELDNWQFIVFTYDKIKLRLYKNGSIVNDVSCNLDLDENDNGISIGKIAGYVHCSSCDIASIRIYNRALSESEITTLYETYRLKMVI